MTMLLLLLPLMKHVVELAEGANVITIMVKAQDAATTKTYTLTVDARG